MAKPIPDGYHSVTPYLIIKGAAKALEFYTKAFGAKEVVRMPGPGGTVMHAEMDFGDCRVMMGEENVAMGAKSPQTLGGAGGSLLLYVEDVDAAYAKAIAAGCTATMPVADMFWGDRYGKLADPFGHEWAIATHTEDVPPEEMEKRMAAFMAEQA